MNKTYFKTYFQFIAEAAKVHVTTGHLDHVTHFYANPSETFRHFTNVVNHFEGKKAAGTISQKADGGMSVKAGKLPNGTPVVGEEIKQTRSDGKIAKGYVASYDSETKVLKYFRDRSLYFGNATDQTDHNTVTTDSNVYDFQFDGGNIVSVNGTFTASINTSLNNTNKVTIGSKVIDLGVTFTNGLANPEINKKTGDIIYIDNRPLVERDIRQKEDVKIILEF
jgi:hypothetical protein